MERFRFLYIFSLWLLCAVQPFSELQAKGEFSTAGFYELPQSGRSVYNMNVAWRFYKGDVENAERPETPDQTWRVTSLPDGIELLPEEASGGVNYQGIVWYRKHFQSHPEWKGKKVFVYFEGIMGKSEIWINGKSVKKHYGGYLPIVVDVSSWLSYDSENVIAVCADNSDDSSYPPGKPQYALDFAYFGGIYRDCWLVVHDNLFITDPNYEDHVGGGGIFVTYPKVSEQCAQLMVRLELKNETSVFQKGAVCYELSDKSGKVVSTAREAYRVSKGKYATLKTALEVLRPSLWSPESPSLYWLTVKVEDAHGKVVDGYRQRVGIRSIEMRGKNGFFLNGKPYPSKLIGGNRHQDFANIGNALPNSLHWRDAFKLRNAGMTVIRAAHYPQDPAFLDACDELGLFIIEATPGWQFWNPDPLFAQRVFSDIRNIVRRDRNRPSLFFMEPILNETHFPEEFALQAKRCVEEEMANSAALSAIDPVSEGWESYPVIYSHPLVNNGMKAANSVSEIDSSKVYFTREFGDNVDGWGVDNSNSRPCRIWGEIPMLLQTEHYAAPRYPFTCIETLYEAGRSHIGGTLWHSFDHQRGCMPIVFYGGIMDAYRQPKTSYYMFMSQRPDTINSMLHSLGIETGPMVYIAHEMTQFSPADVKIFSNCEEVRLTVFEGGKQYVWKRSSSPLKMPSPVITFKDVYDVMEVKALSRAGKRDKVYMLAEGLENGKVVAVHKRYSTNKPLKIRVRVDDDGLPLVADGSDLVTVIAEVVDERGDVKRLNNHLVRFSIEGEGELLEGDSIGVNPVRTIWGTAPILLRATATPGKIRIKAEVLGEGIQAIEDGEITLETVASTMKFVYREEELHSEFGYDRRLGKKVFGNSEEIERLKQEIKQLKKEKAKHDFEVVTRQQEEFGEKR